MTADSSVKKVAPYPFSAELEKNALKHPVEVMNLTYKGAILRLKENLIHVGEVYNLSFSIPALKIPLVAEVRVLKTLDRALSGDGAIERLAEVHFQNLSPDNRAKILSFLTAIGQDKM